MKIRTRAVLGLLHSAAALLLLAGCGGKKDTGQPAGPPVVRVQPVVERDKVVNFTFFTGRTDADESVELRARVSGYLVPWKFDGETKEAKEFNFVPGQPVKKGQVLFKIDPRPYKAEEDKLLGQVGVAKAREALAEADNRRAQDIIRTPGALSEQDLDKYKAAVAEAKAAVTATLANAEGAKLNMKFTDVEAPVDGIVGRNLLTSGNLVTADKTLLTTIVSQDRMFVYFDIDENTMLTVQKLMNEGKIKFEQGPEGRPIVPVSYGLTNEGDAFPHTDGRLDFINNQVDPNTGTIQVRAILPNPARNPATLPRLLRPGLFVRVKLPLGEPHKALLVHQESIGSDQSDKFVRIVGKDDKVETRPVTVGAIQEDGLQVVDPVKIVITKDGYRLAKPEDKDAVDSLKAGDRVIVSGLQKVQPGVVVEPKPYQAE